MPKFFINRPVFAWVIAIAIILGGLIAIPKLPIERFPSIAPPQVSIYASYPGATPQTVNDNVIRPIERELTGVDGLLYFESSSDLSGMATITATFRSGTNADMAQVDVQNKLKLVEPKLPQAVRQNGLNVESASSNFLMIINLESKNGTFDPTALSDYMSRNVMDELKRVPGVGRVQLFGAERAMRIWPDPSKLNSYSLTMSDVTRAIAEQNVQIAPGALGAAPTTPGQSTTVPLIVDGQLRSVDDFKSIILRSKTDGSKVTLNDVAKVESGAENYSFGTRVNGRDATAIAVMLSSGANAVATSDAVTERMKELAQAMPHDMNYSITFNTAPFVKISIIKVLTTLLEAMFLVFIVMYLFLQEVRYTLIPAIVVPIALLGTFAVMLAVGSSVNVLTMFGMVLAIGIIVDDAIVVVENVERLMVTQGLSPKEATIEAMSEITGAVIGITLVLSAVFIPMAFSSGSVGAIYRQFSLTMATSILFSAFMALSLTPALCATMLKPISEHKEKPRFFKWFESGVNYLTEVYGRKVGSILKGTGRAMAIFATLVALLIVGLLNLPSSFLPEEDQGYLMTSIQLPYDATTDRTLAIVKKFEAFAKTRPGIESTESVMGYSFSGAGQNAAMIWTVMKDWSQRHGATAGNEVMAATMAMSDIHEGLVMSILPPAIDSLGNSSGFSLRLQDRGSHGYTALVNAQQKLLGMAAQSKIVTGVYPESLPPGMSLKLDIDRAKAQAMGVPFSAISDTLSTALGSAYVNDFPNNGFMQQVIVQADAPSRMQINDVLKLYVGNAAGGMVPLAELVKPVWVQSPLQMINYNGYPSMRISGSAAPGYSSGAAMQEMERLAAQLPKGFSIEWTGLSLEEKQSGAQAPVLLALSMFVVFLILAALYESWSIPIAVIMVVPLGLIGAVAAVYLRGLPNDIFFKVGLITIIGLSAKNAILIVEFAKAKRADGLSLVDATIEAAKQRLRPIIMTSLAFTLGVVPLMLARGASAETQHAIGTGVFGGMISATVLAIFLVPVFFVVVMGLAEKWNNRKARAVEAR